MPHIDVPTLIGDDLEKQFREGITRALGPAAPALLPLIVPVFVDVLTRAAPRDGVDPDLMSVVEAARRLGIGRTKIYELIESGRLPSVKIGKRRLISHEMIEAFRKELLPAA